MKKRSVILYAAAAAALMGCLWAWRATHPEADARPALDAPSRSEIDRRIALVTARLAAKSLIADEVVAGRLSLLEAEAQFRDWDAREPRQLYECPGEFPPGASEDERRCRSLIAWVRAQAPPNQAAALARQLEAELEQRPRDDP